MEHKCGQCALKALQGGMCPIFRADMSEKDGCPYFTSELRTCHICGSVILGAGVLEADEDIWHEMCQKCAAAAPCAVCQHTDCRFQSDRFCQEPPFVMVEQRKGNMIVQSQMLNPKRVQATCAQGCTCYYEDEEGFICLRQEGCGCKNYKTNWRNKQ